MRAKFINEFGKGIDPRKTLKVGLHSFNWGFDDETLENSDKKELIDIINYYGWHIKIIKINDRYYPINDFPDFYIDEPPYFNSAIDAANADMIQIYSLAEDWNVLDPESEVYSYLNVIDINKLIW